MKVTRHCCDVCGAQIHPHDACGTLTVHRAPTTRSQDKVNDPYGFMQGLFSISPLRDEKSYDVCVHCCEGWLRMREWLKRQIAESMEEA